MNRIKLADQIKLVEKALDFGTLESHALASEEPEHALFVPLHYEKNYSYPLVIWMHDADATHRQVNRVLPKISMRNYVGIGPASGNGWQQDHDSILEAEASVAQCISVASENYNIESSRIFIAGAGTGGTMAYRVALNHPDWFAGALSFCGAMPADQTPLADFKRCRKLPCFVAQARESAQFDVDTLCSQLRLMYSAGFNVTVRQYPEGEQLSDQVLHDMNVWIMELVTGQSESKSSTASTPTISGDN